MRMRMTAVVIALVALVSPAYPQAGWWDRDYAARREVRVYPPTTRLSGDDAAIIEFQTVGLLKDDGSDIRVVSGSRVVPHRLYGVGPGDKATIAFKVESSRTTYHVYFGNPQAEPPSADWEPQRGLILETRAYQGGDPGNLRRMMDILERAGPFQGAGPVDRIWHGHNEFGPTENFVSRYIGWFFAGVSGRYCFATSSDDASFLLVDGKLVVAWPGWHGPVADARHNAAADLERGLHRIEYLHVNGGAGTCAVAAWQPPGAQGFEVIPASVFAPLSRAVVGDIELRGGGVALDFDYRILGEALLVEDEEFYAVRVLLSRRSGQAGTVIWEFGDGISASGPSVTHVYLSEGVYEVKMSLGSDVDAPSIRQRINVHRDWRRQFEKDIDDITDYYIEISRYDPEKLDSRSLLCLATLLERRGSREFVKSTVMAMVTRSNEMDLQHLQYALEVLDRVVGPERMAADTEIAATLAEGCEKAEGNTKALLALELAGVYFESLESEKAEPFLEKALLAQPGPRMRRRLLVRLGDAARYNGLRDAARKAFEAAAAIEIPSAAVAENAKAGALALSVEDFLRTRDFAGAEAALVEWDFAAPLEKLAGYNPYLWGRLYALQERTARALFELESIPAVSPESPWAPKALLAAAKLLAARGERDAALERLAKIENDYKTSPERDEAVDLAERIGLNMKGGAP